jgi:hypothetical protein
MEFISMFFDEKSYYKMTRFKKYNATDMNLREFIRIGFFYNFSHNNMPFVFYIFRSNYFEQKKEFIKYYEYGIMNSNFSYNKYISFYNICSFSNIYTNIL